MGYYENRDKRELIKTVTICLLFIALILCWFLESGIHKADGYKQAQGELSMAIKSRDNKDILNGMFYIFTDLCDNRVVRENKEGE